MTGILGLRQWFRHILVYGVGTVLLNSLPFLMIPIYTHRVPPSEYGVLELLNRSQELLIVILSLGMGTTLLTFYQMEKDKAGGGERVYSTALQSLGVFSLAIIGLLLAGSGSISEVLFGSRVYASAVVLILAATYFQLLFQAAVAYLQSRLLSGVYVTLHVARLLFALGLNLVLVYWWRWGLRGILWATLLHTGASAGWVLVYTLRRTWRVPDRRLLWEMLRFGLPLVPASLAGFVLGSGDRYFLNVYGTRHDVGIYGLGYRLGLVGMTIVLTPFVQVWSAVSVDLAKRIDGPRLLGRIATYLLAACVFVTLALSLFAPYLLRVLAAPAYWNACRVVPIVGAAYIFYSFTPILDASFYVTKRTSFKPLSAGLSAGVILLLYWALIPHYGMMGAAWATLGGFASLALFTSIFSQRVYRIEYQLGRIGCLFLLGLILYEVGNAIPLLPMAPGILGRVALTMAFPLLLWVGRFLTAGERQVLEDYWKVVRERWLYA